jgi:SPOR domain
MRNVFLALLFANLAYFGWARWIDVPPTPPVNETIERLPRLKLAGEVSSQRPVAGAPERTALRESQSCLSVGPFDTENRIKATQVLRTEGFDARQREQEGETSTQYLVFIGSLKTDADADRVVSQLKEKGFRDAAIVPASGKVGRRVSLGPVDGRAGAQELAVAGQAKGFKVEVVEQKVSAMGYWLDFEAPAGTSTELIQNLFADGVKSQITVQPCPAPAGQTAKAAPRPLRTAATSTPRSASGR